MHAARMLRERRDASRRASSSTWRTTRAFSWRASSSTSRSSASRAWARVSPDTRSSSRAARSAASRASASRRSSSWSRSDRLRSRPARSAIRASSDCSRWRMRSSLRSTSSRSRVSTVAVEAAAVSGADPALDIPPRPPQRVGLGVSCQLQTQTVVYVSSRELPTPPPRRGLPLRARSKLPWPSLLDQALSDHMLPVTGYREERSGPQRASRRLLPRFRSSLMNKPSVSPAAARPEVS